MFLLVCFPLFLDSSSFGRNALSCRSSAAFLFGNVVALLLLHVAFVSWLVLLLFLSAFQFSLPLFVVVLVPLDAVSFVLVLVILVIYSLCHTKVLSNFSPPVCAAFRLHSFLLLVFLYYFHRFGLTLTYSHYFACVICV